LRFPLAFIAGYHNSQPIGLLPLQFNTGKGFIPESYGIKGEFLEFFGGDDTDSNTVFLAKGYEHLSSLFLQQIPSQSVLAPLAFPYSYQGGQVMHFTNKYITALSDYKTFLQTNFEGKSRQKLINHMNRLQRDHRIEVIKGDKDDLELLFQYNQERFGERSSFKWEYRKQIFQDLFDTYPSDVFTVVVDGVKKAASFSLVYKKTYLSMNIGYDYAVRDLGKFVVVTQLQQAVELGCNLFDAGKGDTGWKEQFRLKKIPQYMLRIGAQAERSVQI
jgi:hypothetical protein